jgi:signal transduction histidine kinase
MRPLNRLRWRLTAWYVATFGAILVAFSVGLFFTISHSIAATMDRSLVHAAGQVRETVLSTATERSIRDLKIPDRALYLFDASGLLVSPDTASPQVRRTAQRAAARGEASQQFDIGHEHTLLVHALRFAAPDGRRFVALASADTEELEDEYANLITVVSISLGVALIAVGVGGYVLARGSSQPVEESFERMRRFMADAAHELRTPIAFVRAQSDLALEHERSVHEYVDALREVGSEANRIGTIVDDLFTLARADAGERRLELAPTYLDDVVLDAMSNARALATTRGVQLDITEFEEAPVLGDRRLLGQLVRIVVENAIKYTPEGGTVTVGVVMRDGAAVTIVQDTGIGIPPSDLSRVFDRFYRTSNARSVADGAGLGLSIAQWIVGAHRGRLDLTSAPDRGTRASITIPALDRTKSDAGVSTAPASSRVTVL